MGDNGAGATALPQQSVTYDPKAKVETRGRVFWWRLVSAGDGIPDWKFNAARDAYLRGLLTNSDYGLLAGALSIMVMKAVGWQFELQGGAAPMREFMNASLTERAELGQGWPVFLSKFAIDFYSQDKGAFAEILDLSFPDEEGGKRAPLRPPAVGIAHLDAACCELTRDPAWPVIYHNPDTSRAHILHDSRVIHIVDQPTPDRTYAGLGLCAVSRVLQRAQIIADQGTVEAERVADLPPPGFGLANNFDWGEMMEDYELQERQRGRKRWRDIPVYSNLDPEHPASFAFTPFRSLPEGYDPTAEFQLTMLVFAMAWGVDVRDFTSLSQGELGTAAEAEVKQAKARGMGTAYFRQLLATALNTKFLAGTDVTFAWTEQDDEQERARADIQKVQAETLEIAVRAGIMTGEEARQRLFDAGLLTEDELRAPPQEEESEEEAGPTEPETTPAQEGARQAEEPPAYTVETLGAPAAPATDAETLVTRAVIRREIERWRSVPALAPYAPSGEATNDIPAEDERALARALRRLWAGARQASPTVPEGAREALAGLRVELFRADADALVERLAAGEMTLAAWEVQARLLVRDLHTGMMALGKGGWGEVTFADWGRVGAEAKKQYAFLHGFAVEVYAAAASGQPLSRLYLLNRLRLYGEAGWVSYWRGSVAAQGINPADLPAMPGDGSTRCLVNCKCGWQFTPVGDGLALAYWRLGAVEFEHCDDCLERAAAWAPWPGGPVRMEE